ncbi:uncharacterized protein LOC120252589 [Dioscorea cayenensis subsp. rotundata]|uniref:Uncharacterized protein LOC120252589 n=1 Tax=Dioscorea cayennensis subsp. rotundata TaxID=55577 RepID=A0AB40AP60_DIOCR|nr:uncharacterized protein LOC120252589 [Dioscorea cayenensis subsp. rotundata]
MLAPNTEVQEMVIGLGNVGEEEVQSDYGISDELQSCSSTDEEDIRRRPTYVEFNDETDMKDPHFRIGMKFRSFKQFREAVRNYGIKNICVMKLRPNNSKRCKAFCKKGCPFYLLDSPMATDRNTIQIKSGCLKHECTKDHKNRHVSAQWIAHNYLEQFRANPSWKAAGIIQAVRSNQCVDISRLTAWRAKAIATRLLEGDEEDQMKRLYDYRLELLETHPGSTIMFRCIIGMFQAMYVCLSPLRAGFLAGCRRIISLDGCFLKSFYGRQLLAAVGIDANDCIYPIA